MKKFLPWILASGGIMLGLPCLAVTFLEDDSGMATCLILLFALNPIYAICAGVYAGKDIKNYGHHQFLQRYSFWLVHGCFGI